MQMAGGSLWKHLSRSPDWSSILAASLFLRTKGRYAQWVDVSDNTLTMESLLAEAMLKKGVKKEEKEEEKNSQKEKRKIKKQADMNS